MKFPHRDVVRLDRKLRPILLTVIDTEEEFDWGAGFDREATGVTAMKRLPEFQAICGEYGIRPTYVIDYPIASQSAAYEILKHFLDKDEAVVGAHLHPWVNPPTEEEVCPRNSFPGNLPPELEARKIRALADEIERTLGERPTVYKAGRYGLGPQTFRTLVDEGFVCDLSAHPGADLRPSGGPDYSALDADAFWTGPGGKLLELPVTSGYRGLLWRWSRTLNAAARAPLLRRLPVKGVLARSGLLERLRLSPEGMGPAEHRRLTETLLARGLRIFTFSFHSPTLMPGCTSYVRSEQEQKRFLETCAAFFDYFVNELGGTPMTPLQLRSLLRANGREQGTTE